MFGSYRKTLCSQCFLLSLAASAYSLHLTFTYQFMLLHVYCSNYYTILTRTFVVVEAFDSIVPTHLFARTGSSGRLEQVDQLICWWNKNNFQLNCRKCKEALLTNRCQHTDNSITDDQDFDVVQSAKRLDAIMCWRLS